MSMTWRAMSVRPYQQVEALEAVELSSIVCGASHTIAVGPGRYCSITPRRRMPLNSTKASKRVSVTGLGANGYCSSTQRHRLSLASRDEDSKRAR